MSKTYTIDFVPRVEGQLRQIPKDVLKLIFDRIDKLKANPRPEVWSPLKALKKEVYKKKHSK